MVSQGRTLEHRGRLRIGPLDCVRPDDVQGDASRFSTLLHRCKNAPITPFTLLFRLGQVERVRTLAVTMSGSPDEPKISITPLLKRLWHETTGESRPTCVEIAAAVSYIFTNSLSEVQTGALLTCLHFTGRDRQADVLSQCSDAMRTYATQIDTDGLSKIIAQRGRKEGSYHGGLV
jgi:hypothetical protein